MSNRVPVTEATVEIRTDGRLRVRYREVPEGRDRSEPPSLKECMAAVAKYRGRRWTPERHRAVLEVLAACGHITLPSLDERGAQGDGCAPQGDTPAPARRQISHGQGDSPGRRRRFTPAR